ncbi:hypothetical protein FDP41_010364 [Naegleria fowleri]|uniref:Mitochondrial outer membrane transport complex Sam37/metaxin N-terminal domain-containing protein n=1 Tax=Naegleria fowleri TaxID=5763 RepID=A0A6A5CDC2_NAEFO|nr:uncharacterized protein FDP41_010364 [Naegleria fowleri]KAF0983299.1 hypothetical protein FDP41_010364 [Naegleria fowleri]CAG4710085.1 unnamed protein product [Naegleria fowleri]
MFYHQASSHHHQHTINTATAPSDSSSSTSSNSITLYVSYEPSIVVQQQQHHDPHTFHSNSINSTILHPLNIDIYSSIIYSYLVFSNIKFQVKISHPSHILSSLYSNHTSSNDIHFPILVHDYNEHHIVIYGMKEILNYLKSKGENLDANLTLNEHATTTLQQIQTEIEAYSNIVHEKCLPFYLYSYWFRDDLYQTLTRDLYFNNMSRVVRWAYMWSERSRHVQLLKSLTSLKKFNDEQHGEESFLTEYLLPKSSMEQNASIKLFLECLDSLSMLLGSSNRFLYGDSPSTLDAIAFGYLSTLYYPAIYMMTKDENMSSSSISNNIHHPGVQFSHHATSHAFRSRSLDGAMLIITIFNRYPNIQRWINQIQEEYTMIEYNIHFAKTLIDNDYSISSSPSLAPQIASSPNRFIKASSTTTSESSSFVLRHDMAPNKRKYFTFVVVSIIGFLFYLFKGIKIKVSKPVPEYQPPEIYYYDNQYEGIVSKK